MKASTGLGVLLLLANGCGGGGGGLDSTKLAGEWRLAGASGESGALVVDPTNGAAGYATYASGVTTGSAGALTVDDGAGTITIGPETFAASYTDGSPATLDLTLSGSTVHFERLTVTPADTISLSGQAKAEVASTMLDTPRVTLLALLRGAGSDPFKFFVVPASAEPMIDVPVDFAGAQAASFTLARAEGALGVERITFGTTGFAAVNAVIAYEDRDHDGKLGRTVIDDCADTTKDCIRGVSPIVLAARDGDSAELQTAGYGLMRVGWALSAVVADARRENGTTLVPLDPGATVSVNVTFAADPSKVSFPSLHF